MHYKRRDDRTSRINIAGTRFGPVDRRTFIWNLYKPLYIWLGRFVPDLFPRIVPAKYRNGRRRELPNDRYLHSQWNSSICVWMVEFIRCARLSRLFLICRWAGLTFGGGVSVFRARDLPLRRALPLRAPERRAGSQQRRRRKPRRRRAGRGERAAVASAKLGRGARVRAKPDRAVQRNRRLDGQRGRVGPVRIRAGRFAHLVRTDRVGRLNRRPIAQVHAEHLVPVLASRSHRKWIFVRLWRHVHVPTRRSVRNVQRVLSASDRRGPTSDA